MTEITATLKNASRTNGRLRGAIYGDTRGRFEDGEIVITSNITKELPDNIFHTIYSTYKVEFEAPQA